MTIGHINDKPVASQSGRNVVRDYMRMANPMGASVTTRGAYYLRHLGPRIPSWNGRMYSNGVATDDLDGKRFVVLTLSSGAYRREDGPMPVPMPVDEEWFPTDEIIEPYHYIGVSR